MIEFYMNVILVLIIFIVLLILTGYISGKIVSLIIIKGYRLFKHK